MRRIIICSAMVASVVAAPAMAKPKPAKPGPDQCVPKKIGYKASGELISNGLTQTAGADTAKRRDDRYGGTLTINVTKANHKAARGEQTYTVENARVRFHPHSATTPREGDRVKVSGRRTKLAKHCGPSNFTPTVTVRKVDFKAAKPKTS